MIPKLAKQITTDLHHAAYPVWAPSALFLLSLFFLPNNKFMGGAIIATLFFTLMKSTTTLEGVYYITLLCLPFTKGKGFQFPLISADQTGYGVPYTFDFDIAFWNILLLLLLYIIIRTNKQINKSPIDKKDIFLVLFIVSLLPSTLLSRYPDISLLGLTELLFMILLYFVTKLLWPYIRLRIISIIIALQLAFEGVWSVFQFVLRRPLGNAIESSGGLLTQSNSIEYAIEQIGFFRSRGTFDHSNSLGSFAVSLLPFFVLLLMHKKCSAFERMLFTLCIALGSAAVIVSGSRASIFVALMFVAVIFLWDKKRFILFTQIRKSLKISVLGVMFFALFLITPRMVQLFTTLQEGGGATYRMNLNRYALQIMQQNIFGVGLGLFPEAVFSDVGTFTSFPAQPHNLFSQIAAEGGAVSLITFCIFLFASISPNILRIFRSLGHKSKQPDAYILATTASLIIMLVLSQAYPFLLRSSIFPYFWVFLAIGEKKDYNDSHELTNY